MNCDSRNAWSPQISVFVDGVSGFSRKEWFKSRGWGDRVSEIRNFHKELLPKRLSRESRRCISKIWVVLN